MMIRAICRPLYEELQRALASPACRRCHAARAMMSVRWIHRRPPRRGNAARRSVPWRKVEEGVYAAGERQMSAAAAFARGSLQALR